MTTHNPLLIIQQLQSILSSPSKKIGFLFGAGISMEKIDGSKLIVGVDDKKNEKEEIIEEGMTTLSIKDFPSPQKEAIGLIKSEIESESKAFNVETLLSKISEKERAVGIQKLCGLTKAELLQLREDIQGKIRDIVSVHEQTKVEEINHNTFTKWISNADREFSVEIFTTNYDYLLELAMEKQSIGYFDGFVGSYKAFFCPEWIEHSEPVKDWVKLWKLHGSLGWSQNDKKEIVRTSGDSGEAMIYPSFLKYEHSKKQPYLSYMDRLSYFLREPDSVLFICGYSFGDEHINDVILTALNRATSSHVFILKSGEMSEKHPLSEEIAQKNSKISVYAKRTAVIGGKFGKWKLDKEPDRNESYNILDYAFDEDAALDLTEQGDSITNTWTGEGDFRLGNFKKFTEFLSLFYRNSKYIKKQNEK